MWRQPRTINVNRGVSTWVVDYLTPSSVYHNEVFARRFGLPNDFLMPIVREIQAKFRQRWNTLTNAAGHVDINGDVNLMAMLRVITEDNSCDHRR